MKSAISGFTSAAKDAAKLLAVKKQEAVLWTQNWGSRKRV
jgi:hypothetical protein